MSDSAERDGAGIDVDRLERLVSRTAALVVIAGLAGYLFVTGKPAPNEAVVALLGLFVLGKLVVLAVALKERYRGALALVFEVAAFVLIGRVIVKGAQDPLMLASVVAVAVLLLGGTLVRRRARQKADDDE